MNAYVSHTPRGVLVQFETSDTKQLTGQRFFGPAIRNPDLDDERTRKPMTRAIAWLVSLGYKPNRRLRPRRPPVNRLVYSCDSPEPTTFQENL